MSLLMVKEYDDNKSLEEMSYPPSDEVIAKFRENVASLGLSEEEDGVVAYFLDVVPVGTEIHKDQYEIGRQVGIQQHRVSLVISALVGKGIITKGRKGKYNYYKFNLGFEVPVKRTGLVIPFRKKIEGRGV